MVKELKIILNIVCILIIMSVSVVSDTINDVALSLVDKDDEYMTAYNIDRWVEENINYKFYFKPRGIRVTWETREGDCTDKSILKKKMYDIVGIESQIVHGYLDNEKHDWIKVKPMNEYNIVKTRYGNFKIYDINLALFIAEKLNGTVVLKNDNWIVFEDDSRLKEVGLGVW